MSRVAWLLVGLIWSIVAWCLALLAPHLALWPGVEVLHLALPGITVALIGLNLGGALRQMRLGRRPLALLPNTAVQVALFTALFAQIAAHLGAEHYKLERAPQPWDWLGYSLAHAVRASDMLDVVEAYGLRIQAIRHDGWLVGILLVAYHLVVSVFVLNLIWAAWSRRRQGGAGLGGWTLALFWLWLVVWLVTVFWWRPWHLVDIPLWFLDNVLRVLDFADAMDSFEVRLHQVPRGWLEGTLTFFCRLFLAVGLGLLLALYRKERPEATPATHHVGSHPVWLGLLLLGSCVVLFIVTARWVGNIGPDPAISLLTAATGTDELQADRALRGLRRMGVGVGEEVFTLARALPTLPANRQVEAARTLGYLGPNGLYPLARMARGGDEALALAAVEGLGALGPVAAPHLVQVHRAARHESVRSLAANHLTALGNEAVPVLMKSATQETLGEHLVWIRQFDRNWTIRPTDNYTVIRAQNLTRNIAALSSSSIETRHAALDDLENLGPLAAEAIPGLHRFMETYPRHPGAARALVAIDPDEARHPEVRRVVQDLLGQYQTGKDDYFRKRALDELGKLGPAAAEAAPVLLETFPQASPATRVSLIHAVARVGPVNTVGPALVAKLTDPDRAVQFAAARGLCQLGHQIDRAVPILIDRLQDPEIMVRWDSVRELRSLGPRAKAAFEPLLEVVRNDKDLYIRSDAAETLGLLGVSPQRVLATLIPLLSVEPGNDATLRKGAGKGLGHLGPVARESLPALRRALKKDWEMLGIRADLQQAIRSVEGW